MTKSSINIGLSAVPTLWSSFARFRSVKRRRRSSEHSMKRPNRCWHKIEYFKPGAKARVFIFYHHKRKPRHRCVSAGVSVWGWGYGDGGCMCGKEQMKGESEWEVRRAWLKGGIGAERWEYLGTVCSKRSRMKVIIKPIRPTMFLVLQIQFSMIPSTVRV